MAEKAFEVNERVDAEGDGRTKEIQVHSVALTAAVEAQPPKLLSKGMLKLYFIMTIGYLVSTLNGFDSSLMGSINAMESYQKTFGLSGAGSSTGIIFIVYNLGQIAAFPFCGFFADGYGRRVCIFVGCALVLVGTAVQVTAHGTGHFIAGRFILGFGASIASAAGPTYTVELAHPAYRGFMAGMYNNFWWLGNILAGWTTYGTNLHLGHSSWAWRLPTLVQCILPGITMSLVLFFPESPRWLIMQNRHAEALAVMAKYHAPDNNPSSPIVQLQYQEITADLTATTTHDSSPWYDFSALYNTRPARYRLALVIAMSFFGQWSGNNVVSYFLPQMVLQAGIRDPSTQLLISAINPLFSMLAAILGASLLDRLGRRTMLLGGLAGALVAYILLTAFTARTPHNPDLAYGTIVSIYAFGIFFAWGWTPLQTLYAVECLETRTRAKGSGLNFLFLNVAMMVNTYGISVGIERIGWRLYLVYIGWIVVEMGVVWGFFVETAGHTLEELGRVFEARRPVEASLRKVRVERAVRPGSINI
ncbi:general substrate transporter [Pseudovirgaria hyperparasitica]|uniref:General substrate transporter n=1 Tax=Pseudovirgaria hyperparasitica TaxID=470096 RepID=A0A6A6WLS2_9PEZI|nr:general substrate transporter [Pseudovirgaria hyperparasitica]KAF2763096.1 general substrate transporter [Pseudovirgaria hyperparasitica]